MGKQFFVKDVKTLDSIISDPDKAAVWMLCHYPDHPETDERAKKAAEVYAATGLGIWLFGSSNARYPEPVEVMTKQRVIEAGVPAPMIQISSELVSQRSLDTIQEMKNVVAAAKQQGKTSLICISNSLQLMQIFGFLRKENLTVYYVPSQLKDWRWWYIAIRLGLAPLAYLGVGENFIPLKLVRHGRSRWKYWRI